MNFVLKEMTDEDVQKVILDFSKDEEARSSSEYTSIAWNLRGVGGKSWAVDVTADCYMFMARSLPEEHSFRYFAYFERHFVVLELHGLNDVVITGLPPSLQLRVDEVRSAIRNAFKVLGRWGDGGEGDVFDTVDAQFQ